MGSTGRKKRQELQYLLSGSLDGDLSEGQRRALDDRLASDSAASAELERWRHLDRLLKSADRVVVDGVAFLAEHRRRRACLPASRSRIRHLRWMVPAAAAAAILIVIGLWPAVPEPERLATPAEPTPPTVVVLYARGEAPVGGGGAVIEVRYPRRPGTGAGQMDQTAAGSAEPVVSFAVVSTGGWRPEATGQAELPPI